MRCTALELENRGKWRQWILAATLIWGQAQAVTVEADINGDTLRWVSAQTSFNGGIAPTVWVDPAQLTPATAFIPGASTLHSMPLSLVGPEGQSVPLSLTLLGMEYNSPEAINSTADAGGGSASVTLSGGLVQVQGTGLGNHKIALRNEVTPFTHARPVISLGTNTSILQAFSKANAAPGTYTTKILIPQAYEYERNGVRIRYNWTLPLTITITYAPSVLNDLNLTSPTLGEINVRYYNRGGVQYAAGETIYNGVALGYFKNGLKLKMKTGNIYQMSGPDATSIPYSVSCSACMQPLLVNKGSLVLSDLTTSGTNIPGANTSAINFSIHINFTDIATSTLKTGTYQGTFSLLFEPNV
ncbi:hypothetical protein [Aeromonas hydrophila]|uniref:hypothetical protein n=1 Tax=Aeromonas hydrophila TaxID=644 RepID=UPI000B12C4C1|nr:hypothetical protein [Aeromonas hydrophila]